MQDHYSILGRIAESDADLLKGFFSIDER